MRFIGSIIASSVKPCSPVPVADTDIRLVRGREEDDDMHSLRDLLQEAKQTGKAIGHFNISDLVLLKAVFWRCARTKRTSLGGFIRRRARVCRSSPDRGICAKFTRGIRLPDFSERGSHPLFREGRGGCKSWL